MEKLSFIYNRQSVRSFTNDSIPNTDIEEIIKAATYAPSGKNMQNWHFVVVKNSEKIAAIAQAVVDRNKELAAYLPEEKRAAFQGMVPYHTVFKKAPVVILVFAGPYPTIAEDIAAAGTMDKEQIAALSRTQPGIQNIAAAMENLLLAAAAMGYGTCWMTGPTYAAEQIAAITGFSKPGYYLAAMTPLGIPAAGKYVNPPRKPLAEVLTIIE
ncbi:MAG: nitroreductase family protein [Negativicutes bacterium]|nr:nitroreductase family protein [Negativicutes bacterium]